MQLIVSCPFLKEVIPIIAKAIESPGWFSVGKVFATQANITKKYYFSS